MARLEATRREATIIANLATPGEVRVQLGFDARREAILDGFLRLGELYDLELDTGLVVLSGCGTALGKEIRGPRRARGRRRGGDLHLQHCALRALGTWLW